MNERKFIKEFVDNNEGLYRKDLDAIATIEYSYDNDKHHDAVFDTVQSGYVYEAMIAELGIDEDSEQAEDLLYALVEYLMEDEG